DMLDEAIKHYTDAIKINPKYSQAYNNRGNAYGERGLYEAALADFNQALVYEEYAYIYYHRAFTLNKMGRVNDAVIDYTKAIGRDPEYVDAYNNRGNMYFRQEQFDLALKDYEKALEYDNKLVHAHYSRGLIFKKRQQLKLAYESFTTVTELDPSNGIAYFQRSLILAAMGQKKEAIKNAKKAELRGYRVDPFYLDYLNETK
ncbi:MAG: tetratricopeptide (TPR) repeat protein, partial [Candidatus Omnitrophota bacterium]